MARRSTGQILDLLLRLEPLLAEGLSLSKASKTLGTSSSTVKRWRQSG